MVDIKKIADDAFVNRGNLERMKRVMRRAQDGETIVVGFLGGSITQGSLSSTPKTCYAYLVYEWWKNRFPNSEIQYINAGIGGTTSQFGVARVEKDLLKDKPDFVIVEFSVNDEDNKFFEETYESLIRTIYSSESEIGVLIVNNVRYDTGVNAQEIHNHIGKHYNLPCISMKNSLYPHVQAGEIVRTDITPDDLHPNDYGHKLVAEIIIHTLEYIDKERDVKETVPKQPIALTKNQYEHSILYQNDNCKPKLAGFFADSSVKENMRDLFKKGWMGKNVGDKISFTVEGTGIAVQYRKTIHQPTPVARVYIDEDENGILLDGNFEETWGDCLFIETVLVHGENKKHKIQIEIIENHRDDKVPFYLVSIIGSN